MQLVKRNVDFVGTAVMAGDSWRPSGTEHKIIMMGFFEKKSCHDVCYQYRKSDQLSGHLCPYPER